MTVLPENARTLAQVGWPAMEALAGMDVAREEAIEEIARRAAAKAERQAERASSEMEEEFWAQVDAVELPQMNWLTVRGVSDRAVANAGMFGVARIAPDRRLYQPDPEGEPAIILPVMDAQGGYASAAEAEIALVHGCTGGCTGPARGPDWIILDLVAIPVRGILRQAQDENGEGAGIVPWYRRRRQCDWINRRAVDRAAPDALKLYRSPWSWLLAGAPWDGAVRLGGREPWRELLGFSEIEAEDEAHAREIAAGLRAAALERLPLVDYPLDDADGAPDESPAVDRAEAA